MYLQIPFLNDTKSVTRHILTTSLFSSAISLIGLLVVYFAFSHTQATLSELNVNSIKDRIIKLLIIAPILENLLMAFVIEFLLCFTSNNFSIVKIIAIGAGVLHFHVGGWQAISGLVLFYVMANSYMLYYKHGFFKRFSITLVQHTIFNSFSAMLLVFIFIG